MNREFNLILLGAPASGKGTQSVRLAKKYNLYNLDMGRETRNPKVKAQYDYLHTSAVGKLTPTSIVQGIYKRIIREMPAHKGILFNGNPKMIGEAKLVAHLLQESGRPAPLVIYIDVPHDEIIKRLKKRFIKINGKLVKRDDDNETALRNRQKYYKEQVSRVVAFFAKKYTVKRISGMGTKAEVAKKIEAVIKNYLKN